MRSEEAARNAPGNPSGLRWAKELRNALSVLDEFRDECPERWLRVAEARIADPEASWAAIGRMTGLTGSGASEAAWRLLRLAGMGHESVHANGRADAIRRRKERRAREISEAVAAGDGHCRRCGYLVTAPGHKVTCGDAP